MKNYILAFIIITAIGCDGVSNSVDATSSTPSLLSLETESSLPPGFPVSRVICAGRDHIQIFAYPDGRMYVEGAFTSTPESYIYPETRYYFYGEPVVSDELVRSGFNILPFAPPTEDVKIKLSNSWCRNADGSKTCKFKDNSIELRPQADGNMMVRTDLSIVGDPTAQTPWAIWRCGNNEEDSGLRVALTNGFSWKPYLASSEMIVSLFGNNLAETTEMASSRDEALPKKLSDAVVHIDGQPVQLFFVSPSQINVLMPSNLDWSLQIHRVEVKRGPGWLAAKGTFFMDRAAMGIHTSAFFWTGQTHVSLAVTGLANIPMGQVRFSVNDRVIEPDSRMYDWLGNAPGYVGYQQVNVNLADRLTDAEMEKPIRFKILPVESTDFEESNEVVIPPPSL